MEETKAWKSCKYQLQGDLQSLAQQKRCGGDGSAPRSLELAEELCIPGDGNSPLLATGTVTPGLGDTSWTAAQAASHPLSPAGNQASGLGEE